MNHRLIRWFAVSAGVGTVLSLVLYSVQWFVNSRLDLAATWGYRVYRVTRLLWPSSVLLMATEGIEGDARGLLILLIAVVANALFYAALGSLMWWLKHALMDGIRK